MNVFKPDDTKSSDQRNPNTEQYNGTEMFCVKKQRLGKERVKPIGRRTVQGEPVVLRGGQGGESAGFILEHHRVGDDLAAGCHLKGHQTRVMSCRGKHTL